MDDRGFFDNLAPTWDENEVLSTPEKVDWIIRHFKIKKGDQVLDLGTGTGVLLPFISKAVGEDGGITAVDYSSGMLERAKSKFGGLIPTPVFLNIDFENENIDGEFDKIIMYCVYPHLHQPLETLRWMSKVNLKEEGEIYIAFPCGPDFINNIHKERHSESDLLPSATRLANYLCQHGLKADVVEESESAFIVRIKK